MKHYLTENISNSIDISRKSLINPNSGEVDEVFLCRSLKTGNTLLISKEGKTILCSTDVSSKIINNEIDAVLFKKLKQKGFYTPSCQIKDCRKVLPTFFIIDFTTKCNMNCYYCLRHFENSGSIIDERQLKEILDYLINYYRNNNLNHIDIQPWGGEPMLALNRIIFMRKYLSSHGVNANITIQTNGLLLNEQSIAELENNSISVGISIDGCKEIHDLHRKTINDLPTYEKVKNNIRLYKEITGKNAGTISVISKMSLKLLEESVSDLVENVGISSLKFNFMHPNSELFDNSSVISDEEIPLFWITVINKIIELNKKGYNASECNITDKACNLLGCGGTDICHSTGCRGGYSFISFSQDGKIYPCEMIGIDEYQIGDIRASSDLTLAIENSIPNNNYFKTREKKECGSCPWRSYCMGGCVAAARYNGKKAGEVDDKECLSNCAIYGYILDIILNEPQTINILTNGKINII